MTIKSWMANLIHDERIMYKLCSQVLQFIVALTKTNHLMENQPLPVKQGMTSCVATGKLDHLTTSD